MKKRQTAPANLEVDPRSRRMFLKSAGGFTLALPFLPSVLTAYSEKALASQTAPLRYLSLFTPFGGLQHRNWLGSRFPTSTFELYPGRNGRLEPISNFITNGGLSPVLDSSYQSLWPMANMIAGSDQPFYIAHNRCAGTGAFSLAHDGMPSPSDVPEFFRPDFFDVEYPSLDQVLANIGGNGIYGGGLGGRRRSLNVITGGWSTSWGRDEFNSNKPVLSRDALSSTSGVFHYLFGSISAGQVPGANSVNPIVNLLNTFWPSGRDLMRALSNGDRQALEQFFDVAQQAAEDYSAPGPDLSGVVKPAGVSDNWSGGGASLQALADIIALAFKSDVTRVVNLQVEMVPAGYDWHALSHLPTFESPDLGQNEIVQIHQNISRNLFARIGSQLMQADPFAPGSSILDNSLMQWTQENKVAHHNYSTPLFTLGSAGGRMKTGVFADVRDLTRQYGFDQVGDPIHAGELINRTFASILYAFNIPRSKYEISRGGKTADTIPLTKGYGHVFRTAATWYSIPNYQLSKIGEPFEFLMKPGVPWSA